MDQKEKRRHHNEYMRQWYAKNREIQLRYKREWYSKPENRQSVLESRRKWYEKNREKLRQDRKSWYLKNKEHALQYAKEWRETHREHVQVYSKQYRQEKWPEIKNRREQRWKEMKMEILTHYGGTPPLCACCGERRIEFLSVDHINADGAKHRRSFKSSYYYWKSFKENDYPPGFRILCLNCNLSLGFHGYCPHQQEKLVEERMKE